MAARMLLKNDSRLAMEFLRKPTLARPQLSAPVAQTTTINEALHLSLNQKSQTADSTFSLVDFLGVNQKLFTGEEGVLSVRECFQNNGATLGGALLVKGRGGSPKGKVESEEETDDEEIDEGEFATKFDGDDFTDSDDEYRSDYDDGEGSD